MIKLDIKTFIFQSQYTLSSELPELCLEKENLATHLVYLSVYQVHQKANGSLPKITVGIPKVAYLDDMLTLAQTREDLLRWRW